jgi:hypothetical protein
MILAEIDLTATKILTPGLFRYRSAAPCPAAGAWRASRDARAIDEYEYERRLVYDCILNPRGRLASL